MLPRAAALVVVSSLAICGAPAAQQTAVSTINVTYISPKAYVVTLNGTPATMSGSPLTNGSIIPAGSYAFVVAIAPNSGLQNPQFTVTGPGVNVSSDLANAPTLDDGATFGPYVLQPGSSYTIEDKNIGASTIVTLSTSSTADSTGSAGSGSPSGTVQSGMGTTSSTKVAKVANVLGTLVAVLPAVGKPTLTLGGKAVKALKPGAYQLQVRDRSKHYGLALGHMPMTTGTTLSGASSVGTRSYRVTLTVGNWTLIAVRGGPTLLFNVSATG